MAYEYKDKEARKEYMRLYMIERRKDPVKYARMKEISKESRKKHSEKIKERTKEWKNKNKEYVIEYNKVYANKNRAAITTRQAANNKIRAKIDPIFALKKRERLRIWEVLHGKRNNARSVNLIGCSYEELKIHIESKFTDGMNWENMGEWHIDHIRPLSSFDLSDIEQQKIAFHYSNQQPLWAQDNLRKGAKYASI